MGFGILVFSVESKLIYLFKVIFIYIYNYIYHNCYKNNKLIYCIINIIEKTYEMYYININAVCSVHYNIHNKIIFNKCF